MRVYRTSVKEDINVGNVFQHLAENYVNQVKSKNYSRGSNSEYSYSESIRKPKVLLKFGFWMIPFWNGPFQPFQYIVYVLEWTIQKPNIQNGSSKLGRFYLYKKSYKTT